MSCPSLLPRTGPQSPCERTDLRMAIVADHLGLSWTGESTHISLFSVCETHSKTSMKGCIMVIYTTWTNWNVAVNSVCEFLKNTHVWLSELDWSQPLRPVVLQCLLPSGGHVSLKTSQLSSTAVAFKVAYISSLHIWSNMKVGKSPKLELRFGNFTI